MPRFLAGAGGSIFRGVAEKQRVTASGFMGCVFFEDFRIIAVDKGGRFGYFGPRNENPTP